MQRTNTTISDAQRAALYSGLHMEGRMAPPLRKHQRYFFERRDGGEDVYTHDQLKSATWWRQLPGDMPSCIEGLLGLDEPAAEPHLPITWSPK